MSEPIQSFFGEYRWLSNFWPVVVELDGIKYTSIEHGYVAAKTLDPDIRRQVAACSSAGKAKRIGKELELRPHWNAVRLQIMRRLVEQKFAKGTELAGRLVATGDAELIEGNEWGDVFWGVCKGKGQNNLGKLLMAQRAKLRGEVTFETL